MKRQTCQTRTFPGRFSPFVQGGGGQHATIANCKLKNASCKLDQHQSTSSLDMEFNAVDEFTVLPAMPGLMR